MPATWLRVALCTPSPTALRASVLREYEILMDPTGEAHSAGGRAADRVHIHKEPEWVNFSWEDHNALADGGEVE